MSGPKTVQRKPIETEEAHVNAPQRPAATDCCEKIRETAYSKWEAAGRPSGDGVEFWLQAEAELVADAPPSRPK